MFLSQVFIYGLIFILIYYIFSNLGYKAAFIYLFIYFALLFYSTLI